MVNWPSFSASVISLISLSILLIEAQVRIVKTR
jgi:hypothetical protein